MSIDSLLTWLRATLGAAWVLFQIAIFYYPQIPLIQRPVHLVLAMAVLLLYKPLSIPGVPRKLAAGLDTALFAGVVATGGYFLTQAERLTERMEGLDEILLVDVVFGVFVVLALLELVRRSVGWSLLSVLLLFLAYGFVAPWLPGWLQFGGFSLEVAVENLSMTANGVLGITTATSLLFVFYFVVFGSVYAAIGGGQLFIDIGLWVAGRHEGGAAKAAVVSSSMMGSISGSAVANVAATGVFTIPLMRRAGYSPAHAAGIEAIASTGGQLMPPIMGVAAFVMAELLQLSYPRIALAGIIPAVAFYLAIFLIVDLNARRTGVGTLTREDLAATPPIPPRIYLLIPPVTLVGALVSGYTATFSAVLATASCVITCYLRRASWMGWKDWEETLRKSTRQAAEVAVPIAAIGIIIEVAIQSNLALKFSTRLIDISGGTLFGAMGLIIVGCIIMGMGLPTVAAYIVGAILFVPALLELGIPELPAHFFVMYYCVLSMVTPPVALASYTAAGLASANSVSTSMWAFRLSLVSFFIPFAFAFDPALLGFGTPGAIAIACASLLVGTAAWAVGLIGYAGRVLGPASRLAFATAGVVSIFSPTGSWTWGAALLVALALGAWCVATRPRAAGDVAAARENAT